MSFIKKIKDYFCNIIKFNSIKKIFYAVTFLLLMFISMDFFNIPTFLLNHLSFATIIVFILIIVIFVLENKMFKLILLKNINYIDYYNFVVFICSLILLLNYFFKNEELKYIIFAIFLFITFIIFIVRYIIFRNKTIEINASNVLDLQDILNSNYQSDKLSNIFIEENEVSYDLLDRTNIIHDIYLLAKNCNNLKPYVISLKGKWGSGKSTIINNVIRKINEDNNENIIIINDFNPWIYSDEKSILKAMVEIIFDKIGINLTIKDSKKYINLMYKIIFNDPSYSIFANTDDIDDLEEIQKLINEYLSNYNKRVFFIIDNIERAKAENILMVFKSINCILNFERVLYLVSYDEDELKEIFINNLKLNYDYIDKIVNHEFDVPMVSQDKMYTIAKDAVISILKYYKFSDDKIREYDHLIKQLASSKNIREFKKTYNSSLSLNLNNASYLNINDYLAMKYLSIKDNKLFNSIYSNRKYFISEDYHVYQEDISYDNKQFNKDCYNFFENNLQLKNNPEMLDFLANIFPNVMTYKLNIFDHEPEFRPTSNYVYTDNSRNIKSNIEKRVYNGKFFSLYFNIDNNEFVVFSKEIESLIKQINSTNFNEKNINNKYLELINLRTDSVQKYIIETLEYYLRDVKRLPLLFDLMYKNYYNLNNDFISFTLNARSRCIVILAHILKLTPKADIDLIIDNISKDYNRIYIIREILYWLNPERQNSKYSNSDVYEKLNNKYLEMKNHIIDNNINIYSSDFYSLNNIYCFDDTPEINEHFKKFINENTIFKFLCDFITYSLSTEYHFRIKKSTVERYVTIKEIDKIVKNSKITNDKEKIIKEIYEKTIHDDDQFSYGYSSHEFIDYDLTIKS